MLLAALLFVTPASAESAFEASIKRALTEAHCPPYSQGHAVRMTMPKTRSGIVGENSATASSKQW
jgi:hypothetical protein